jgi:hypothetical protein
MNTSSNEPFEARVGDVVSVWKGWFRHVGIVVPGGILQNSPGSFERIVTWQEFLQGRAYHIEHTGVAPHLVIARAQRILAAPQAYHFLNRNCEHTVNEVLKGQPESPQLAGFVWLGALAFVLAVAARE